MLGIDVLDVIFVVIGRGFAGVETAWELNDFLRDAVKDYYHNIEPEVFI